MHQFPDLQWLKTQAEERFEKRRTWDGSPLPTSGWPTVVLNTSACQIYRDNIPGPLSLFMNISGTSRVTVGSRKNLVHEGFFTLTNAGERYTLEMEKQAETFNIHFGDHMAEQLLASLAETESSLLECTHQPKTYEFTVGLHPIDSELLSLVHSIRQNKPTGLPLEEKLADILQYLYRSEGRFRSKANGLDALKVATRDELTRRLRVATEYIYQNYSADIALDELASVACLSKFHLLRQFKNYHKKSPHQFLNEVRIARARELLKNSNEDVKQIARQTGFRDSSSFSRVFVQKLGIYPTAYRVAVKN